MVEERMPIKVHVLQSDEQDERTKGTFDDAWSSLMCGAHSISEVAVSLEELNVLQRNEVPNLFDGDREDAMLICTASAFNEAQRTALKYLASFGGNLAVFFRSSDSI